MKPEHEEKKKGVLRRHALLLSRNRRNNGVLFEESRPAPRTHNPQHAAGIFRMRGVGSGTSGAMPIQQTAMQAAHRAQGGGSRRGEWQSWNADRFVGRSVRAKRSGPIFPLKEALISIAEAGGIGWPEGPPRLFGQHA